MTAPICNSDTLNNTARSALRRPRGYRSRGLVSASEALGAVLLICVVPVTLVWYPVLRLPGFGNVSLSDLVLMSLWPLSALHLASTARRHVAIRRALLIALVTLLPGILSALAAVMFSSDSSALVEFARYLKRFGTAAILPVAFVCFASTRLLRWLPRTLFLCLAAMTLFVLFPEFRSVLPATSIGGDTSIITIRAEGIVTNPNDLAYVAVGVAIMLIALLGARIQKRARASAGARLRATILVSGALIAASVCVVASGSRSGILGAIAAATYYVISRSGSRRRKVSIVVVLGLVGVIGFQASTVFEARMMRVYNKGLGEENVSGRLEAQYLALLAAFNHPLGVGNSNFGPATRTLQARVPGITNLQTTDSVYFDTLLSSGFLGLAILLLLFRMCWRYTERVDPSFNEPGLVLRAGCVAFLVFGTATVTPASVFAAPIFFSLIGSAALLRRASTPSFAHNR